jgi:hypothetical protein
MIKDQVNGGTNLEHMEYVIDKWWLWLVVGGLYCILFICGVIINRECRSWPIYGGLDDFQPIHLFSLCWAYSTVSRHLAEVEGFLFPGKTPGGSLSFVLYCISWLGRFHRFYLPIVFLFKRFFLQTIGNIGQLLNDSNDVDFTSSIRLIYK